jgi:hypothetical protein
MDAAKPADDVLVLNPNVSVTPAGDYPEAIRARLGGSADDFVISERRSRYAALRVDQETASFVQRFSTPIRLVEAVAAHSARTGEDPFTLLDAVFPLVAQLRAQRVLISPEDARPSPSEPRFAPGTDIAGYRVVRCVEAQTETEIYKVETRSGHPAALKWVPRGAPTFVEAALDREERVLGDLENAGVRAVPQILASGADEY